VPFVGGDEEYYRILHEQHGYPSWRWDYDVALGAVDRQAGGRALDVGAGTGVFLSALGSRWSPFAVEGSETTRAILRKSNVTVFRDLSEAAARLAGSFQLITLFQVLEHIADFRPVLSHCRDLLAPGGTLVITVPECDAMLAQPSLTGEHDMPPNHVGKWTERSLALALQQAGLVATRSVGEPPSWKKAVSQIYGRVRTDGQRPGTLASAAYRIPSRGVRIPLLAIAGMLAAPRLLPRWRELRAGGAFATIARGKPEGA
jgi:SAM-dependent methyltransferase